MMNFRKLTCWVFFSAFLLCPSPSFPSDDAFKLNFIEDDHAKDRQAIQDYLKRRQIADGAPINVLAIDGGGIRGIVPATFLEKLEAQTGLPVRELFDFVVGTSTGGIISMMLQLDQFETAADIAKAYANLSQVVFPPTGMLGYLLSWFSRAQYYETPLEQQLEAILTDKTLRELPIPTAITSVRVNDNVPYIFKTYRAAWDEKENFFLKDVGRATSAAPTYFPMKQMKPVYGNSPTMSFTDGGLAANDPAIIALSEAYRLFGPRRINLISLGTGSCPKFNNNPIDPIYLFQAGPIIDTLWSAQISSVSQILSGLDPSLGDFLTYRRAQIPLPEKLMPMDCADNVGALHDIAGRYFDNEGKRTLDRISDLLVAALKERSLDKKPPRSVEEPEEEPRKDIYFYKPSEETITLGDLLGNLNSSVRTLVLSGRHEVDDEFIRGLSAEEKSESLANIDLSGTSVTQTSLTYILGSQILGTKREAPQIDENYGGGGRAYSEIYLNVQGTQVKDTAPFKGFADGFTLRYNEPANNQVGMKRLRFQK